MNKDTLKFAQNWNGKLTNTFFSTIRPWDDLRFILHHKFDILLYEKPYCIAELVYAKKVLFKKFTPGMAYLDLGMTVSGARAMMNRFYADYIFKRGDLAEFGFYIFKRLEV